MSSVMETNLHHPLSRQLLVGSLPIVMMFDIPETLQVDDSVISKVQVSLSDDFYYCKLNVVLARMKTR